MLSSLRAFRKKLAGDWHVSVLYVLLLAAFGGLLWMKLGSLTGGYGASELLTTQQANSWQTILQHPLYAPFTALVHALSYIADQPLFIARAVAALCGIMALCLFYALVRYWHGSRAALFGTILFGSSAWFLHTARLGAPEILMFGLLALIACFVWLKQTTHPLALLCGFILVAALLYVPGMIWFIALGVIWQWRSIDQYFKKHLGIVSIGGVILLAALVPLGLAIYHNPEVAKVCAGLPMTGWPMPLEVLKNLWHIPLYLFVQGPNNPEHWLGKIAIIDFFTTAMFLLGGYLYLKHARLGRFWLVAIVLSVGAVLASLGGEVTLSIILPFIYVVAAAGAGFMLDRWLAVFPRNRIAQAVGYSLISAAVLAVSIYSYRHYFVAWPQAPETKAAFTVQQASASDTMKQ